MTSISKMCAICGEAEATTKDHLPPKSCFSKPRPSNLITVDACEECNGGRSDLDNKFSVFLAITAHGYSEEGQKLWGDRAKRYWQNTKFQEELKHSKTIINGQIRHHINFSQFNSIYESILRGVYFHKYNEICRVDNLELFFRKELKDMDRQFLTYLDKGVVGKEQFVYGVGRTDEGSMGGIIGFYDRFYITAIGIIPSEQDEA